MHGDRSRARWVEGGPRSFSYQSGSQGGNVRRQAPSWACWVLGGWWWRWQGEALFDSCEMEKQMQRGGGSIIAGDGKYSRVLSLLGLCHWCHVDPDWLKLIWEFSAVSENKNREVWCLKPVIKIFTNACSLYFYRTVVSHIHPRALEPGSERLHE